MATSLEQFARELRAFNDRKAVTKQLKADIRSPLPQMRKKIKGVALATLPKRGGLNKWVASIRINGPVKVTGSAVTLKLSGGRNSQSKRSDMKAIDRGRVRAPSWGRRNKGAWHTQQVQPGFFTDTVKDNKQMWLDVIEQAVDKATAILRR